MKHSQESGEEQDWSREKDQASREQHLRERTRERDRRKRLERTPCPTNADDKTDSNERHSTSVNSIPSLSLDNKRSSAGLSALLSPPPTASLGQAGTWLQGPGEPTLSVAAGLGLKSCEAWTTAVEIGYAKMPHSGLCSTVALLKTRKNCRSFARGDDPHETQHDTMRNHLLDRGRIVQFTGLDGPLRTWLSTSRARRLILILVTVSHTSLPQGRATRKRKQGAVLITAMPDSHPVQ